MTGTTGTGTGTGMGMGPSAHKPTASRTSRVLLHVSEYVRHLANEPSVGQYYVREHVHKSVRQLTEAEATVRTATREASEGRFDAKGAMEAVASMHEHGEGMVEKKKKNVKKMFRGVGCFSFSFISSNHAAANPPPS